MTLATLGADSELIRWVSVLGPARQLAEVLADTDFVPKAMRGKPDQVCAAIMYGDELGLGPMQALAGIDVVEGHPRPSAELSRALIYRAGHTITVHEMSGTRVRVSGLRAGSPESDRVYVEWTADMARAAGLASRANWRSYPRAMLLARATSDLARLLFPDVVKGLGYIVEDRENAATLEAWGGPAGEPPVAPPLEAPAPQRQTKTRRPQLRDPGYAIATKAEPGPDGSYDVPIGESENVDRPESPVPGPTDDTPDLPPETPDDGSEPDAPPAPIRPGKLKALHTLLTLALGTSSPVAERRALLAQILGHEVTSTKALTQPEGDHALDVLAQIDKGTLTLTPTPDGFVIGEATADPADDTDPWSTPADDRGDDHIGDPWRS